MKPPPRLVALVAPTGAGKTATLLALAARRPLAVLSADSVQAIQGFDIGSAKPDAATRAALPHYLLDVVPPQTSYDAGRFAADTAALLATRTATDPPLIASAGTGLYLKAIGEGLADLPPLETQQREALRAEVKADPPAAYARLAAQDPETAAAIHPNDVVRIARALEIAAATGTPASAAWRERATAPVANLTYLGIWAEGPAYENALAARVTAMLRAGWIAEVEGLIAAYGPNLPGLRAVGYAQIAAYLRGELAAGDLALAITTATRRYAKRQRTWFKRLPVRWFPYDPAGPLPQLLDALERALDDVA